MDAAALQEDFINVLEAHPQGITDNELKNVFKAKYVQLAPLINELAANGRLKLFQRGTNELIYQLVKAEDAEKFKGLSHEHMLVYQEIERAGDMGIWTRDIKDRTNLQQQTLTKILKTLETRRLVKSVKSIASKNKKLFMLFDLVPNREITGGPWYTEQEFDRDFIDSLRKLVEKVIRDKGMATLKEITEEIRVSGISKVALGPDEVMSILNTLLYDFRIEEVKLPKSAMKFQQDRKFDAHYKVSSFVSTPSHLIDIPCGVCPVMDQCAEGNIISPSNCEYYNQWLQF